VRIVSAALPQLQVELVAYAQSLEAEVVAKIDTLAEEGWEAYAARLKK
jgi:hypothetical protein